MVVSLTFLGAADGVTGSRTLVEVEKQKWLVDCGLFQGAKDRRESNWREFPISIDEVSGVILTHAHLDHSGYLPRFCHGGYLKPIYCSEGTADLCQILWRDAAFLEEEAARYANATGYSHHKPALPLFTTDDAEKAISLLRPLKRDVWHPLAPNIQFRFVRAGHIIGASLVQLDIKNGSRTKRLTFSGDLGHDRSYVLRGPENKVETDFLLLESTYGERLHSQENALEAFEKVYLKNIEKRGVLIVPAFAVGRSQEIITMIRMLEDQKRIPAIPVILDSPMAIEVLAVTMKHQEDLWPRNHKPESMKPKYFETSRTPDESMLACMREGPAVVVSASGMLSGGRVLHHLKHRLPDANNTVLFCGYQAEGTKGRFLQENAETAKQLRIHHQNVDIQAEILTMDQLSAHGDRDDLLAWLTRLPKMPELIVTNHGSPTAQQALVDEIKKRWKTHAVSAYAQRQIKLDG